MFTYSSCCSLMYRLHKFNIQNACVYKEKDRIDIACRQPEFIRFEWSSAFTDFIGTKYMVSNYGASEVIKLKKMEILLNSLIDLQESFTPFFLNEKVKMKFMLIRFKWNATDKYVLSCHRLRNNDKNMFSNVTNSKINLRPTLV